MNNDDALYLLEIESNADASAVRQAYERRRLEFEQRLTNATSSGLKDKYHTTLSDLDQAYQLLIGADATTRREQRPTLSGANAKSLIESVSVGASTGGTLLRSNVAASDTHNDLAIGQILANRYEIRRVLGQGGMGAVYEAFDALKQENVAIKALLPQFLSSEQGRDRFMHEAKVACRLAHPNIVKVFDVGLAEPYHFITMELLEGQTLRAQMEEKKSEHSVYSVAQVLDCARQLIAALEYAHKQIVHRDLKPENVWVCEDGTLKLIDFGIARAFTKSALTRTGMVMGTAYYMAPEQFNGAKDVDWRADQYSLAVMLYEMLAGRIPQGTFATTSALRKDVPLSLSRALMQALSPDPADRFESLSEFSTALSSRDAPRALLRKSTRWIAASAVAVAALAALWWSGVLNHFSYRNNADADGGGIATTSQPTDAAPTVAARTTESATTNTTTNATTVSPNLALRLQDEVLVLFKRLQERDQTLSDSIAQQLPRYNRAVADVQSARNSAARAAAEATANAAGRELQLRREIQQETHAKIFPEPQWSALTGQIRAAQSLSQTNAAAASSQFSALRDALLGKLKLFADIESFVHARADYFDAKHSWLEFSALHGGRPPHNPAIHAAENNIQTAIDRGEYAHLATNVFPQLIALYSQELQQPQRSDGSRSSAGASTNVSQSNGISNDSNTSRSTVPTAAPTKQEIKEERARVAAEKKRAEHVAKCAKARRPSRSCRDVQDN